MEIYNIEKKDNLGSDTSIYKYMSMEAFFSFLHSKKLMFSKLSKWPDAFEGDRFEFFKLIQKNEKYSDKTKDNFLGCSWTLQTEDSCFYDNESEHGKAEKELKKFGSASMWETYCKYGGLRMRTTIGKVDSILKGQDDHYVCYKGRVRYKPSDYLGVELGETNLISKLFYKKVCFRHESEYRFILASSKPVDSNEVFFGVRNIYDFVDEFLISPATSNIQWISKMLLQYAVGVTNPPEIPTNIKSGKQYCRISDLYGNISDELTC